MAAIIVQSVKLGPRRRGMQLVEAALSDGTTLDLDAELAVQFQLRAGMEVSEAQLEEMRGAQMRLDARRRLIRYLALRRKTRAEAEAYLRRNGIPPDAAEEALAEAERLGYLDDARFAESYVRTQERTARKGPRALKFELTQRGVARDTAREAVAPSEDPAHQAELAAEAARRRLPRLAREEPAARRRKLAEFLMRRGFDPSVVAETVRSVLEDQGSDEVE